MHKMSLNCSFVKKKFTWIIKCTLTSNFYYCIASMYLVCIIDSRRIHWPTTGSLMTYGWVCGNTSSSHYCWVLKMFSRLCQSSCIYTLWCSSFRFLFFSDISNIQVVQLNTILHINKTQQTDIDLDNINLTDILNTPATDKNSLKCPKNNNNANCEC